MLKETKKNPNKNNKITYRNALKIELNKCARFFLMHTFTLNRNST